MISSRRSFITGLAATFAAPAIVRARSLMPVKAMPTEEQLMALLHKRMDEAYRITAENMRQSLYGDLSIVVRRAFVPRLHVQIYRAGPITVGLREGWLVQ